MAVVRRAALARKAALRASPHIHLVVVPLDLKADARRGDGVERYGLVGRLISGPGQFDQLQDDYAAAMTAFGLARGVKGSGRKNEPVPVYLARLAAKEREADELRVALIRDLDALAAERAEIERQKKQVGRDHQRVLDAVREAGRRNFAAFQAQLEAERLVRDRAAWTEERDAAEASLAARQASHAKFREDLIASREHLVAIFDAAKTFTAAAAGMSVDQIAAVARPAVEAARRMVEINRAAQSHAVAHAQAMAM